MLLEYFSELSAVKEHDKKVTKEAQQAQEDVSRSYCPLVVLIVLNQTNFTLILNLFIYSWKLLSLRPRRMPAFWLSTTICMSSRGRDWRLQSIYWLRRESSGAMPPTVWPWRCVLGEGWMETNKINKYLYRCQWYLWKGMKQQAIF